LKQHQEKLQSVSPVSERNKKVQKYRTKNKSKSRQKNNNIGNLKDK